MSGLIGTANSRSGMIDDFVDTAKVWVSFDHNQTTSFNSSYNVSSVTDNSTGNQRVNFIRPMRTTNYVTLCTGYNYDINCTARSPQVGSIQVNSWNIGASALYDMVNFKVAVFGDA